MNLPQELIEEIIYDLTSDVQSLQSCSLVAKSWAYPSRKWLFEAVILSRRTYQRWMDRIPPENIELLRNVRSFGFLSDGRMVDGVTPNCIDFLHRYLPSLHHLENLGLQHLFLGPDIPQKIGLFSAFQQTLSSLSLGRCDATSDALITIINYFPLLANLDFQTLIDRWGHPPVAQLSQPLRGRLVVADCISDDRTLFDGLSSPSPKLDELVLRHVDVPIFYDCIVGVHGGSVKHLEMDDGYSYRSCTSQNLQTSPTLMRNTHPQ